MAEKNHKIGLCRRVIALLKAGGKDDASKEAYEAVKWACRWISVTTGIALVVAGICLIGFQCCIHDVAKLECAEFFLALWLLDAMATAVMYSVITFRYYASGRMAKWREYDKNQGEICG